MGLSRKNSTNRRSVYYPINIFHHSSTNILNKTNPIQSPVSSPSCVNTNMQSRAHNRQKMQHHRSSICVINSMPNSYNNPNISNQKCTINNNLNASQLELASAAYNLNSSLSLSSSPTNLN